MLNLNNLYYFVAAVEHGGFAAAARGLGVPKSTISKKVAELEADLGTRLIHRTSRSFKLSDLGHDFYQHARASMISAESAEIMVRQHHFEPSGPVKISCSVPTAQLYLASHLPRLASMYPKLELQLDISDRFVDLIQEGIDIVIRCHFNPLPDSTLVQRKALVEQIIMVAAPAYLTKHGTPNLPDDLQAHIGLNTGTNHDVWHVTGPNNVSAQVKPLCRFIANESSVLQAAAEAGLGICCLPERFCQQAINEERLKRVLPAWQAGEVTTTLLYPHRRGLLPSVRATIDFLIECLQVP